MTAVYPSADDDVITSPYNSVLAMHQLTEHADCVLPIENQVRMVSYIDFTCRLFRFGLTGCSYNIIIQAEFNIFEIVPPLPLRLP